MTALKRIHSDVKAKRGRLYKVLKSGALIAPLMTVGSALNHEHLKVLFGETTSIAIITVSGLASALLPSVTQLALDWFYPEEEEDEGQPPIGA